MAFAVAFIGMILVAVGISVLPGGTPKPQPPVAAAAAPAQPQTPARQ
jgi:hypothetical protein